MYIIIFVHPDTCFYDYRIFTDYDKAREFIDFISSYDGTYVKEFFKIYDHLLLR